MEKQKRNLKVLWYSLGAVGGVAVVVCLFLLWLYTGTFTSAKFTVFKALPLPIGKVAGKYVTISDLQSDVQVSNELGADIVRPGYLRERSADIKIQYLVKQYNAAQVQFRDRDLSSRAALMLWWTGNEKLNPRYAQIKSLENQLGRGAKFADLASKFSEDAATKQFGGDAGYVNILEALPEFRAAVSPLRAGDYAIVPTRYGLELVLVEDIIEGDSGKVKMRIRHIMLESKGFDAWLERELDKISVQFYIGN
jgi:hypothetical protein